MKSAHKCARVHVGNASRGSILSLSVKFNTFGGHSGAAATCAAEKPQTRQAGIARLKHLALYYNRLPASL